MRPGEVTQGINELVLCFGEMPETLSFHGQDRKYTWHFRQYNGGFAIDF
jgi:hypothetical protein